MKNIFTEKEYQEIEAAIKSPPERGIARKILVVKMVMESLENDEITKYMGYNANYIYAERYTYKSSKVL